MTAVPAMPNSTPTTLFQLSFSSLVTTLAMTIVQNGVVALSTEASPAPSAVWPRKISENGMTLLSSASRNSIGKCGRASAKDGPRASR